MRRGGWRGVVAVVAIVVGVAPLSAVPGAADGLAVVAVTPPGLDSTFGSGGRTAPLAGIPTPSAVAATSDGRVLVGTASTAPAPADARVLRLSADGVIDGSFGSGGSVLVRPLASVVGLSVRPDGQIVVVAHADASSSADLVIARLSANGAPDATFGSGGVVTFDLPDGERALMAAVQSTGAVVVASTTGDASVSDVVVRRWSASGVPDATFGVSGTRVIDVAGRFDEGAALAVLADDSIVVAATSSVATTGPVAITYSDAQVALAKLDASGAPETTFGASGVRRDAIGSLGTVVRSMVALPGGGLVVAAQIGATAGVPDGVEFVAYTAAGARDASFGSGGAVSYAGAEAPATLLRRADGELYAAGGRLSAVRLRADGSLDPSFGLGGRVLVPYPSARDDSSDYTYAAMVDPQGRLVAATRGGSLVRYRDSSPMLTVQTAVRVLDTRHGQRPPAGAITRVDTGLAGRDAVLANITVVDADADGYVTAGPCSTMTSGPQGSSNANAIIGRVRANLSLVRVDPDGGFCIYTQVATQLVVDVGASTGSGAGAGVVDVAPTRVADTRSGAAIGAGTIRRIDTRPFSPVGTSAVFVNLTTLGAVEPGYVTADRCSRLVAGPQRTSTTNATPGEDVANGALIPVDDDGAFCVWAQTTMHLLVDLTAAIVAGGGGGVYPVANIRVYDTRSEPTRRPSPMTSAPLDPRVLASAIPEAARGILANTTATNATAPGYATIDDPGTPHTADRPPAHSTINYRPSQTAANTTTIRTTGALWAYSSANADLVVDLQAVY